MLRARARRSGLLRAVDDFVSMDWTFASKGSEGVHLLHPYPARFIPDLPGAVLDLFAEHVGGAVLDPFCGCGTTNVEAQRRGLRSFGVDLNPIAAMVARVKTQPLARPLRPAGTRIAARAAQRVFKVPELPRLDHWFTPGAQRALAAVVALIEEEPKDIQDALRVALSRIIVRVSNQESDTRYAAIPRDITAQDVLRQFEQSTADVEASLTAHAVTARSAKATILEHDVLKVSKAHIPEPVGLVVTSPPYPNAYEYWLYHKYRMYWLGHDPLPVKRDEIGARPHYFKRNPATVADFRNQMGICFRLFHNVLKPDGLVVIVVGRSIIHGEFIDNGQLLKGVGETTGFKLLGEASRRIPRARKSFNPQVSPIEQEQLLLFQRVSNA